MSIPFLPSMAQSVALVEEPMLRFITSRSQQGTYKKLFRPDVSQLQPTPLAGETKSYDLTKISGPISASFGPEFNALKGKINIYSGLSPMVKESGHNYSTFLCAYNQASPNGNDIFLNDAPPDKQFVMPNTPSIDRIIADKAFGAPGAVMSASMTDYEPVLESQIYSYILSGGKIIRPRAPYDPSLHFDRYFASATVGGTTAAQLKTDRRALVVDLVLNSFKSFVAKRTLAMEDKKTLDGHMESLYTIENNIRLNTFKTCSDPGIVIDPKLKGINSPLSQGGLTTATYKLVIDIAVAAMRCNAIRVFNLCMHASAPTLVGGGGPHGMHHMDRSEVSKIDYAGTYEEYYGQMLAYLISKMEAIQETTGTMLDNSLVLYGKEMSTEGHEHQTGDMLVATLGSLGGRLKTGQLLDYRRNLVKANQPYGNLFQDRSYNQFLTSIMQGGFGIKPEDFEFNGDFGERHETIWANTPFVEKRVLLPGMFV